MIQTDPTLIRWLLVQWSIETGSLSDRACLVINNILRDAYYGAITLKYGQTQDSLPYHYSLRELHDLPNADGIDLVIDAMSEVYEGHHHRVPEVVIKLLIEFEARHVYATNDGNQTMQMQEEAQRFGMVSGF